MSPNIHVLTQSVQLCPGDFARLLVVNVSDFDQLARNEYDVCGPFNLLLRHPIRWKNIGLSHNLASLHVFLDAN